MYAQIPHNYQQIYFEFNIIDIWCEIRITKMNGVQMEKERSKE